MANIKHTEIYNPGFKDSYSEYLKNEKKFRIDTIKTYLSRIRSFSKYEFLWNKDLFDFSIEEFQIILRELETNYQSVRFAGSVMISYLEWANIKKLNQNNIDFLNDIDTEFYRNLSNPHFLNKDEIDFIIANYCDNPQEKLVVLLVFEGVDDTDGYFELRNIKVSDFNENERTLNLYSSEGSLPRILKITEQASQALIDTYLTEDYIGDLRNKKYITSNQGYVIKNTNTNTTNTELVDSHTINRIFARIKKRGKLKHFDGQIVRKSGMLYLAKNLWENKRRLGKDEYNIISNIFKIKNEYNVFHLQNTLEINLQNICKFYNDLMILNRHNESNNIWRIKEENGLKGEEIIYSYLKSQNPTMLFRKPFDFEGYDIEGFYQITEKRKNYKEVHIRAEIKTILANGRSFFITLNELSKANFYKELYDLYIVRLIEEKYFIYKINNPIEFFSINLDQLSKIITISNGILEVATVRLNFDVEVLNQNRIL